MFSVPVILIACLVIFFFLNLPVGIAIGFATLCSLVGGESISLSSVPQAMVNACDSFPILAVPMFILAGDLMGAGGVSRRILNVCNVFFGRITGGIAIVTVLVCMFFAAVSGSGPATVAAVGSMVIPTMIELGYKRSFALALVATAGTIGVIIPPSIPMVLYGVSTGASVVSLFTAGIVPGIFIGVALMLYAYVFSKLNGYTGNKEPFSWKVAGAAVWDAKWALINPVIILGGIYCGIFTPTEAAAVAVIYAFICGTVIHRELPLKKLYETIATSSCTTGTILVILATASAFSKVLTVEQIPELITESIISVTDNKILLLLLINVLLLIVGCFMDQTPAILILAPILLPIAQSIGVDPVHFGIIMVCNLAIGFITPPLGMALFVAARVSNSKLEVVLKGIIPFLLIMITCLMCITYIPEISMFLPNLMK